VNGRVHTNGLENFWSLLKRGLNGTYVAVEPFYLFRYWMSKRSVTTIAKTAWEIKLNDGERFSIALSQVVGNASHTKN
jgi:hypothetical protein